MHHETLTKAGVLEIERGGGEFAITACLKSRTTQITRLLGMSSQIRHCLRLPTETFPRRHAETCIVAINYQVHAASA